MKTKMTHSLRAELADAIRVRYAAAATKDKRAYSGDLDHLIQSISIACAGDCNRAVHHAGGEHDG